MNPNDLKQILDALTYADVREFSLRTGSFDLNLKRGPQAFAPAPGTLSGGVPAPQLQQAAPALYAPPAPQFSPAATEPATANTPSDSAPAAPAAPAAPPETAPSKGTPVKAPIVGTFYSASSPDAPAYVKVGDTVSAGQVLCIIEAMKLMNEIEAEQGGVIREILVKNAEPVEYGQTLFIIE
ncbi:acetyl-CoA carboxylase biotin carboxyl carrier protein [Deinococcus taeanensis]|uniref:acetyl-CoA carboxylase biotin carboxyl carrier protein n=1 Tax=Deinococcus taeanensis TaxID=2737050 RepID=UPI001CDB9FA7|nr:acetyl-CoA carboxylase biotin carboxyl carrier protein [Deinococcus taeanensis]UBV42990.1 acetyl-CoA carboxylase biotin carboxyl carrier protein [Deinococcus taeanensis]